MVSSIKGKALWKLSSQQASSYFDGRIVLVGDSAHSFPPAGGLGMNSGILDAHNLAHRIAEGLTPDSLKEYSLERSAAVAANIVVANELYARSLDIARTLGLDVRALDLLEAALAPLGRSGAAKQLFAAAVKLGSLHLESDLVSTGLAARLRQKHLHIPMLLLDHEFQQRIDTPRGALHLLPKHPLRVVSRRGLEASSTLVSLRTLAVALGAPRFRLPVSLGPLQGSPGFLTALDCPESELLEASLRLSSEAEARHFISRPELVRLLRGSADLSRAEHESGSILLRKDGYLETGK